MALTTIICDPTDGGGPMGGDLVRERKRGLRCETCIVDASCDETCEERYNDMDEETTTYWREIHEKSN